MPEPLKRKIAVMGSRSVGQSVPAHALERPDADQARLTDAGKSSLVARYVDGPAQEIDSYHPTIEQIRQKRAAYANRDWDLDVVDTAGQVRRPPARWLHTPPCASLCLGEVERW